VAQPEHRAREFGALRKYEAAVVQPIVHGLGAAPPELRALAGKWPDAALKRRLAVFALDPNDSRSM
jgi:hypothetical protein